VQTSQVFYFKILLIRRDMSYLCRLNYPEMFAVVQIAGHQFKVSADQYLYVNRLPQAEGEVLTLEDVMLVADGNKVQIGKPYVKGATVQAKVLSHLKDDKVLVFKKKRRKGYKKTHGHRQYLTKIQIEAINA